ncbi:MAG: CehA/McbA family metallohydrolase [Bryobacteraceae bacterium]
MVLRPPRTGKQALPGVLSPRRLTYVTAENLALMHPELDPLADLAAFSVQLLFRAKANREAIFQLNREIKTESFRQHYRGSIGRPRTPEQLCDFIRAGYESLSSPDLTKVRIRRDGIEARAPSGEQVWAAGTNAEVPLVIVNETDRPSRLTLSGSRDGSGPEVEIPTGEARGFFVLLVPQKAGKGTTGLHFRAEAGRAIAQIPVDVRNAARLKLDIRDERGQTTAARVYVTGPDGLARSPSGAYLRVVGADYNQPFAGDSYFHTDGSAELTLPEGKTEVEVVKGFDYRAARRQLDVRPGSPQVYSFRLTRIEDMPRKGWYSGETHIHANVINNEIITPEEAFLQTRGEDLNVANMMVSNTVDSTVHDRKYFTGRPHPLSKGDYLLYWNEEMRSFGLYGHMGFVNLKRLVEPLFTGFAGTAHPEDYPPNYRQAVEAKKQGGVVTQVHPGGHQAEYPVDLALGAMDVLDVMSQGDEEAVLPYWHRLLNCGLRCPISAGTDTFLNVMYFLLPGGNRVYARVEAPLTYQKWIDSFRQGRSFATNGPLLFLTVNGREAGDELRFRSGPVEVKVDATATSQTPMERLDIIRNGTVVASVQASGDRQSLRFSGKVSLDGSGWVAARVDGPGHRLVTNDKRLFAHTSPVYCTIGDQRIAVKADAQFFVGWIDRLIADVETKGRFTDPAHRQDVIRVFRQGQDYYRRIAAGER